MKHKKLNKIDGRKARWFDCDWNSEDGIPYGCTVCKCCKYNDFLDWATSVCGEHGTIQYDRKIDEYDKLETIADKRDWLLKNL